VFCIPKGGSYMNIGRMGINPTSSQFRAKAIRVAQSQAGTIKDKKDPTHRDETKGLDEDKVSLSKQGEKTIKEKADSASQSGVMSELMKREKKDQLDETTMFGGERKLYGKDQVEEHGKEQAGGEKKVEDMELGAKLEAMEVMSKDPEEVRGDTPKAFFDTAKKIVEGQIQKGKPADNLRHLKEVETAPLELSPLKNVDIMPIHDSKNKPIPMDMGTGTNIK